MKQDNTIVQQLKELLSIESANYEGLKQFEDSRLEGEFKAMASSKKRLEELKSQIQYFESRQYTTDQLKAKVDVGAAVETVKQEAQLQVNKVKGAFKDVRSWLTK